MEELIKLIDLEKEKHKNYIPPFLDELDYLKQMFKVYNSSDLLTIKNLELGQFLTAILITNGIDMSFKDVLEKVNKILPLFDREDDANIIYTYFEMAEEFKQEGILDLLFENHHKYGSVKYFYKQAQILNQLKEKELEEQGEFFMKLTLTLFSDINSGESEINFNEDQSNAFLELFKSSKNKDSFVSSIDFVVCQDFFEVDELEPLTKLIKKKDLSRILRKSYAEFIKSENINIIKDLSNISRRYSNLIDTKNKEEKEHHRKLNMCDEVLLILNNLSYQRPFDLSDRLLRMHISPEIDLAIIKFANNYNLNFCKETHRINKEHRNNTYHSLEYIFTKNNFCFKNISLENQEILINEINMETIEEILAFLNTNNFRFIKESNPLFTQLLLCSNMKILNNILGLLNNGSINISFIQKYPTILFSEEQLKENNTLFSYEKFMKKTLLLSGVGILLENLLVNDSDVFELSVEELKKQLTILGQYKIDLNGKLNNYECIKNPQLLDLCDNFIELGLGSYIQKNPQLLSSKKSAIIKRIIISNQLGLNLFNKEHRIVSKIANEHKFYVPKEKLDNFVINYSKNYIDSKYEEVLNLSERNTIDFNASILLEFLHSYEQNELTYNFNGTIISKNRVSRNLSVLLTEEKLKNEDILTILFQAILHKSLIVNSQDQITTIYSIINSIPQLGLESFQKTKK